MFTFYKALIPPEHFYVGQTTDLKKRLKDHNYGTSLHKSKYKPWNLRGYVAFDSEEKAIKFEQFLKTDNGRIFQKKTFLIPINFNSKKFIFLLPEKS